MTRERYMTYAKNRARLVIIHWWYMCIIRLKRLKRRSIPTPVIFQNGSLLLAPPGSDIYACYRLSSIYACLIKPVRTHLGISSCVYFSRLKFFDQNHKTSAIATFFCYCRSENFRQQLLAVWVGQRWLACNRGADWLCGRKLCGIWRSKIENTMVKNFAWKHKKIAEIPVTRSPILNCC